MKISKFHIVNANQAVARIAFKTNEVCPIYPITPASEMSELVEEWSAEQQLNCFGNVPSIFQMQSEGGVAGAMHGALTTGSLSTTFTASQGLLLMLPNMYKIAGELTPNVIHVATRSIATHALSVFGDHSDIMAVRQSGYAFLGSASVQEAQDFALISQAATLASRIPFVHFFDGFRTSHEIAKIEGISEETINMLMDQDQIDQHRNRGLNPNNPVLRGTAQSSDVFFQSREAVNTFYNACPEIVQDKMNTFAMLTSRQYKLFDFIGHLQAERIIISMASSTETIEETVNELNALGEKVGLIKVRLFRPFSTKHLLEALPNSCKSIAVLDRTKEPGSVGEPLYLDISQSILSAFQENKLKHIPKVIGGRYGLSSNEFTPSMVKAIFDNISSANPKNNFTIGIKDDVTELSLDYKNDFLLSTANYEAVFYQGKTSDTSQSFSNILQLLGKKNHVQGYTEIDYKKSNSIYISHLRISNTIIKAPYLIGFADFIVCENSSFLDERQVLKQLKKGGRLLIESTKKPHEFWENLSNKTKELVKKKEIALYLVNTENLAKKYMHNGIEITAIQACFLALKNGQTYTDAIADTKDYIYKIDTSLDSVDDTRDITLDEKLSTTLLGRLLVNKGNDAPVSMLPVDGTFATDTSKYNSKKQGDMLPIWDADSCTQCGACSMACPQGVIRIKAYESEYLEDAPLDFNTVIFKELDLLNYTIQANPEQCTSCNNCVDACSVKALTLSSRNEVENVEIENWNYFNEIPEFDRAKIDITKVSQQQLQEPLFKYSIGVEGCGEAPYLKLLSQLFGDRLLVANATGASSIFGGALPTTPWSKNKDGRGPAWANSLFEDNAEFGLGYRMSINQQEEQAKTLLKEMLSELDFDLVYDTLEARQETTQEIENQRHRILLLKKRLEILDTPQSSVLLTIIDNLVKKSVWIVGGDGWAYDIGFGGIDHVLASGENINILVIDNEVYDNTGGQMSKATPFGASAKFAAKGKRSQKKDFGRIAMTYDNVYVASVAIGANQEQTLAAFNEAESHNGPSIIFAYTHSESHGIDMKNPRKYHKAAVASGQWLLYRNDPQNLSRCINTLQLDSSVPSIPIQNYLKLEKRFNKMLAISSAETKDIICNLQKQIDKRYQTYLSLAVSDTLTKKNHPLAL